MKDDSTKPLSKVIRIDENEIRGHLDEMVRGTVEETLNAMLDAEAFALPAHTINQLYRCRWQVELFFKWIKQHLLIKAFYGTSENKVKTQIWTAVAVYVLVSTISP